MKSVLEDNDLVVQVASDEDVLDIIDRFFVTGEVAPERLPAVRLCRPGLCVWDGMVNAISISSPSTLTGSVACFDTLGKAVQTLSLSSRRLVPSTDGVLQQQSPVVSCVAALATQASSTVVLHAIQCREKESTDWPNEFSLSY